MDAPPELPPLPPPPPPERPALAVLPFHADAAVDAGYLGAGAGHASHGSSGEGALVGPGRE